MVTNAVKVDLTVILCIIYIAVVYDSDRDSGTEKLKMIENRKDYFKMAYKDQFNTHSDNFCLHYETWILQEDMI